MRAKILSIEISEPEDTTVYDLGVGDNHNFFACTEGKPLLVHNCHRTGASSYANVIEAFNCPKIGLTGTPKRKDGKHWIVYRLFNGVIYEAMTDSLKPHVSVMEVPVDIGKDYKDWQYMRKALIKTKARTAYIVKVALKDVAAGRSIVIPVVDNLESDTICNALAKAGIRVQTWDGRLKPDERDARLALANSADIDITIARRSMLTGINVVKWDTIYEIVSINNDSNFEQEYKRVCTPAPNKKAVVRIFVDKQTISKKHAKACILLLKALGANLTERAEKYLSSSAREVKQQQAALDVWSTVLDKDIIEEDMEAVEAAPKRRGKSKTGSELLKRVL